MAVSDQVLGPIIVSPFSDLVSLFTSYFMSCAHHFVYPISTFPNSEPPHHHHPLIFIFPCTLIARYPLNFNIFPLHPLFQQQCQLCFNFLLISKITLSIQGSFPSLFKELNLQCVCTHTQSAQLWKKKHVSQVH